MGVIVIGAYRPKAGRDAELVALVHEHVPLLRELGFATARPAQVMKNGDGVVVEVFEWTSREAIDDAHENVRVAQMWERFAELCEYESLANLPEAQGLFAHFTPLDMG